MGRDVDTTVFSSADSSDVIASAAITAQKRKPLGAFGPDISPAGEGVVPACVRAPRRVPPWRNIRSVSKSRDGLLINLIGIYRALDVFRVTANGHAVRPSMSVVRCLNRAVAIRQFEEAEITLGFSKSRESIARTSRVCIDLIPSTQWVRRGQPSLGIPQVQHQISNPL